MTRKELIDAVAASTGMSKKDTEKVIAETFDQLAKALASGDKISIVGFGTFEVRERAARTGTNLRTGESIAIAACKVPAFKAGKPLKDAVNK